MRHVQIQLIFIIVVLCIVKYRAHNNVLSKMSTFGTLLLDDGRKPHTHLPLQLDKLQYHGTTTLSFLHKDCVVLCIDSKASVGNYVGSRCVKKVFPVSKSIVATMAGGAADCAYWIRRVATAARGLEYKYSASLNARAIARLLSSSLREYKGQGLSVGTMVAGYEVGTGPSLYYVDSDGACIEGSMFCVGSGSQFAYAVMDTISDGDSSGRLNTEFLSESFPDDGDAEEIIGCPSRLTSALARVPLEQTIETAVRAVRHATYRDGFSGGYINVLVVNATGIHHIKRIDSKTIKI